jgi:hypothetical protein
MKSSSTTPPSTPAVVLDKDTMQQHASGSITGVVVWRFNGHVFPDEAWNDFVTVVLSWWTTAIVRLLNGNTTSETMDFMDGPYSVLCNCVDNSVECRFVDRRTESRTLASCSGETRELGRSILAAGKNALRFCHERQWTNADIQTLEKEVNALRKLI